MWPVGDCCSSYQWLSWLSTSSSWPSLLYCRWARCSLHMTLSGVTQLTSHRCNNGKTSSPFLLSRIMLYDFHSFSGRTNIGKYIFLFYTYIHCPKKVYHLMFDNNVGMWSDFQNSFTSWFVIKFPMYVLKDFHLTCTMLLHYLVKVENPKMLLILTAYSTNCRHVSEDTLNTWFNIWQ